MVSRDAQRMWLALEWEWEWSVAVRKIKPNNLFRFYFCKFLFRFFRLIPICSSTFLTQKTAIAAQIERMPDLAFTLTQLWRALVSLAAAFISLCSFHHFALHQKQQKLQLSINSARTLISLHQAQTHTKAMHRLFEKHFNEWVLLFHQQRNINFFRMQSHYPNLTVLSDSWWGSRKEEENRAY